MGIQRENSNLIIVDHRCHACLDPSEPPMIDPNDPPNAQSACVIENAFVKFLIILYRKEWFLTCRKAIIQTI